MGAFAMDVDTKAVAASRGHIYHRIVHAVPGVVARHLGAALARDDGEPALGKCQSVLDMRPVDHLQRVWRQNDLIALNPAKKREPPLNREGHKNRSAAAVVVAVKPPVVLDLLGLGPLRHESRDLGPLRHVESRDLGPLRHVVTIQ